MRQTNKLFVATTNVSKRIVANTSKRNNGSLFHKQQQKQQSAIKQQIRK